MEISKSSDSVRVNEGTEIALKEQTERDKERIIKLAQDIAKKRNRKEVELEDIAEAYLQVVEGKSLQRTGILKILNNWIQAMLAPITGVTLICAVLVVVFGYFGLYGGNPDSGIQNGFLDIAKIFAGAVVGSGIASSQRKDC